MKKIFTSVLLAFCLNQANAQVVFEPTTFRGAFAPAPTTMWTDNWTNWDPQNTSYAASTVTVTAPITTNTTWTAGNVYLIVGQIYVKNGATLTIQPGTVILGDKNTPGSALFITQGSRLEAIGTAASPIVFTSNQAAGARGLGDWGGIVLLGRAQLNQPGGIANVEGIAPIPDTQFGGGTSPINNDNSGTLKYVRIEFGGYVYQPNKEINGLTLGAVGSATTLDFIQTSFINDDAFEFFGGTVNAKHLVSYRNLDDDFDTDNGWSGNVQFGLVVRDPNIADTPLVSTSEGFESDNDATGTANAPLTSGAFTNITLIGPLRGNTASLIATGHRRGARLRRNTNLKIYNSIFMDFARGIHIDAATTEANATANTLQFKNNLIAGTYTGRATEKNAGSTFDIISWFASNNNDSLVPSSGILTTPYDYLAPDYRPIVASPALSNVSFTGSVIAALTAQAPTTSTPSVSYCLNGTATALTATAASLATLNWYTVATGGTSTATAPTPSTSATGPTTYYVSQTYPSGVESARTAIVVTINALPATPVITANGPTSFCTGGSVILTSSSPTGNAWSNAGPTTATNTVNTSGNYSVTVTNASGCVATSAATTVNVSAAPLPTVALTGDLSLCQGENVVLTASTSDSYLWSPGNQVTQSITVTTAGTYSVTTTNANACNGAGTSASNAVVVNPQPTASGSIVSITNYVAVFANTSTNATSYSWNFGDQSSSTATAPTHAYATSNVYQVILTAINGTCTDTVVFNTAITVSLDETEILGTVVLYPNPAANEIQLSFDKQTATALEISIIDIRGTLVDKIQINEGNIGVQKHIFNTSALESGIYFMQIEGTDLKRVKKFIIQK